MQYTRIAQRLRLAAVLIALTLGSSACYSLASFRTPRLLPPGEHELGIGASAMAGTAENDPYPGIAPAFEVLYRYGVAELLGVGARAGLAGAAAEAGVEATVADSTGMFAASLQVGGGVLSEGYRPFARIEPAALGRMPLSPGVDLVATGKAVLFLARRSSEEHPHGVGGNLGLRVRLGPSGWALHPEAGVLVPLDDDSQRLFVQLGVGLLRAF